MHKCLFLDRDGVINYDYGYVYLEKDFIFREEIFKICQVAQEHNFKIIIITNQAGIARGKFTENDFLNITKYMKKIFIGKGVKIDDIYFCPFHPTEGKGIFLKESYDRKPNPGLILKATKDHNINLKKSIFIGDKETDRMAAYNASLKKYIDSNDENWLNQSLLAIKNII
tara:strand:+ start:392 stop:901 length:510 start_codon:yes stop_codon:yes gene_type:complete